MMLTNKTRPTLQLGPSFSGLPASALLLFSTRTCAMLFFLLAMAAHALSTTTPTPQASKAQIFQDSYGNLHISSAANQSVYVNDMDPPARIRQLEAANQALAVTNEALQASNPTLPCCSRLRL